MSGRIVDDQDNLLSPTVTVHCFFAGRCNHTVTDTPIAAHDAMEAHYTDQHELLIDLAVRGMHMPPTRRAP